MSQNFGERRKERGERKEEREEGREITLCGICKSSKYMSLDGTGEGIRAYSSSICFKHAIRTAKNVSNSLESVWSVMFGGRGDSFCGLVSVNKMRSEAPGGLRGLQKEYEAENIAEEREEM